LTRNNVTATECRGSLVRIHISLVLKRKADILSTRYDISVHQ